MRKETTKENLTDFMTKLERGHTTDTIDVNFYFEKGLVNREIFVSLFEEAKEQFLRYPAVDFETLKSKILKLS